MWTICFLLSIGAPAPVFRPIFTSMQPHGYLVNELNSMSEKKEETTNYLDLIGLSGLRTYTDTYTDAQKDSGLVVKTRELERCKENVEELRALKDRLLRKNNDYYQAWRDNQDLVRKDTEIFQSKNSMIDNLLDEIEQLRKKIPSQEAN